MTRVWGQKENCGQDPRARARQGVRRREQVRSREVQGDGGVRQVGELHRGAPRRDAVPQGVRREAEGRGPLEPARLVPRPGGQARPQAGPEGPQARPGGTRPRGARCGSARGRDPGPGRGSRRAGGPGRRGARCPGTGCPGTGCRGTGRAGGPAPRSQAGPAPGQGRAPGRQERRRRQPRPPSGGPSRLPATGQQPVLLQPGHGAQALPGSRWRAWPGRARLGRPASAAPAGRP